MISTHVLLRLLGFGLMIETLNPGAITAGNPQSFVAFIICACILEMTFRHFCLIQKRQATRAGMDIFVPGGARPRGAPVEAVSPASEPEWTELRLKKPESEGRVEVKFANGLIRYADCSMLHGAIFFAIEFESKDEFIEAMKTPEQFGVTHWRKA